MKYIFGIYTCVKWLMNNFIDKIILIRIIVWVLFYIISDFGEINSKYTDALIPNKDSED